MPADLTALIESLEGMERRVLPGPWAVDLYYKARSVFNGDPSTEQIVTARKGAPTVKGWIDARMEHTRNICQVGYGNHHNDDRAKEEEAEAEFIAAARNSLPLLLKLARLAVEAYEIIEHKTTYTDWVARFDALRPSSGDAT